MYSEKTLKVNGKGTLWVLFVTGMTGLCLSLSLRIKQTRFALTVQLLQGSHGDDGRRGSD